MTKDELHVESVTAKSFFLIDENENKRCELYSTKSRGETVVIFRMTDVAGDPLISIEASSSRAVVSVSNPSDQNTVRMMSDSNGNAIMVCDSENRPKVRIGKEEITFFDENSNPSRTLDGKSEE